MLTQDELLILFWYDELSGKLYWKVSPHPRIKVGAEAGTYTNGYRQVKFNKQHHKAHRVIWIMLFGEIPEDKVIDHKDNRKDNNIRLNLRPATQCQNLWNRSASENSLSAYKGVYWNKSKEKWEARIQVNGISKYLGGFENEMDAALAYLEEAEKHHGEFLK